MICIILSFNSQTLVGASVSKLKSHDDGDIASTAKKLVKKWKGIAKAQGANGSTSKSPSSAASSRENSAKKVASSNKSPAGQQLKRMASAGSSELDVEAEWKGLPQLRINICKKLHTIFLMSKDDLSKELNESAVVCFYSIVLFLCARIVISQAHSFLIKYSLVCAKNRNNFASHVRRK